MLCSVLGGGQSCVVKRVRWRSAMCCVAVSHVLCSVLGGGQSCVAC